MYCMALGRAGLPGITSVRNVSRALILTFSSVRRPKYEEVLRELRVRPLKVQASRGVVVKLTEGAEVEVMAAQDVEAAAGV